MNEFQPPRKLISEKEWGKEALKQKILKMLDVPRKEQQEEFKTKVLTSGSLQAIVNKGYTEFCNENSVQMFLSVPFGNKDILFDRLADSLDMDELQKRSFKVAANSIKYTAEHDWVNKDFVVTSKTGDRKSKFINVFANNPGKKQGIKDSDSKNDIVNIIVAYGQGGFTISPDTIIETDKSNGLFNIYNKDTSRIVEIPTGLTEEDLSLIAKQESFGVMEMFATTMGWLEI